MSKETKYGLLYSEYMYYPLMRIPFEKFSIIVLCIPLFSFLFCIAYSVLFNFESATFTHCQVYNFLPSISAAIGNFTPQRQIWQTAITLQALPRIYVAVVYLRQYRHTLLLGYVACTLNIIENIALIVLSYFTSSKFYVVHEKAFIIFIVVSELYMFLTCFIQSRYKRHNKKSLTLKRKCLLTNLAFIMLSIYFFMRHNSWCEPYIYSLFALSEYIVVLSNMAFHITAYYDFQNKDLIIYKYGVDITER